MCDQKNSGETLNRKDEDELSASDASEPEEMPSSAAFDPELDDDDDDDDDHDDDGGEVEIFAPTPGHIAQTPFNLRGGSSAFSNRSHSIFECLDSVARLASSSMSQDNSTDGVFARPLPPRSLRKTSQPQSNCPTPAKKRGVPDYLVHPDRWTHYNLEDVEETSDQDNRKAAHQFLSSLQQQQQQQQQQQESQRDPPCNIQQKMLFSRPGRLPKEQPSDQRLAVSGKEKETRLSHLVEEDEEGREKEMAERRHTDQSVKKVEENARGGQTETYKEQTMEEAKPAFVPFRKTKRVNYRQSSGRDDN
ncbi:U5 small nuclear ribonucleoprotein TSSC4 isoform 1-T2 [Spinachia spinachia]